MEDMSDMKTINSFWAKKKEINGRLLWLPLVQHLEDTKNVISLLWEHWLSRGQKKFIIESMSEKNEDSAKKLIKFIALVHDIGKATPAFQTKEGFINSVDLDFALIEKLELAGFRGISSLRLASRNDSRHDIAGQYILSKYGVEDDISTIIGGHHGKTIDSSLAYKNQSAYGANYYQNEKNSSVNDLWKLSQKEIFEYALESCGYGGVEELPKISQPGQVLLLGLLVMADWIASKDEYFPLIDIEDSGVKEKIRRKQVGFSKWIKSDKWSPDILNDYFELYKRRFGFENGPRDVQKKLSEVIANCKEPGIFILEAPMGVGKTEASLVAAEQLAASTGRSGIFFGLPTQATSNGIFTRVLGWMNSLKEDENDIYQIRLSHGKAQLNEDFSSIANGIDLDGDGGVIVNQWFAGRKTSSLDDFVVGTIDQFLMLSLKQKHLFLRHLGFSKKVVIIDEVHAYDTYMSQYLKESITWMGAYGVPVVLLSATLPADKRKDIIFAYMRGKRRLPIAERESLKDMLKTRSYPLITYTDGDEVKIEEHFEKIDDKNVRIESIDEENLISEIENLISDGGIVGVIVNTVKRGQKFARILSEYFGDDMVLLLHSGFISTERVKKENELLSMIGKNANRPKKKIIIGTQVIEQSLDIDFDVLISDLSPIDLLIQRLGRLHRHTNDRPDKLAEPKMFILGKNDGYEFEEGTRSVYSEYILMRTQYFLDKCDSIAIPGDISTLVQDVYCGDDIELPTDLKVLYEEYERKNRKIMDDKKGAAKKYRIENPKINRMDNLIGWLSNYSVNNSEEKANAQVRDGDDTIEVVVVKKIGDGYGIFGEDVDISMYIHEPEIAKKIAQNTLILPRIFSFPSRIDKTIIELEKFNRDKFNGYNLFEWQESIWLKGSLGIVLDENNEFELCGEKLIYDEKYGISVLKKGCE